MGKTSRKVNLSLSRGRKHRLAPAEGKLPCSSKQEASALATCTPTLPLHTTRENRKQICTRHHLPKAAAYACEAQEPLSISTDFLCSTSVCAHGIPQQHQQQVRDSTMYICNNGDGLGKANLQGSRTPMSNACLLVRCHVRSRRALHLRFGVMDCISLGIQENKMLLRNNGIFLLVIIISPIYLHQGPTKLGNTLPGTPSNSKFTKS